MSRFVLLTAVSAFALSGCGARGGNDSANAANAAASRTENGQITARVQGVDLKLNLPPPLRRMTENDDFLYPGARAQRGGQGQRFHSTDSLETVAAWYRNPARANRFTITAASREGAAFLLAGTARGGDMLRVRLQPGAQGGTDGNVVVTTAN